MGINLSLAYVDEKSVLIATPIADKMAEKISKAVSNFSKSLFYDTITACAAYTVINLYRGSYDKSTKRIDLNHNRSISSQSGQQQAQ
jgi:hypothetical protein